MVKFLFRLFINMYMCPADISFSVVYTLWYVRVWMCSKIMKERLWCACCASTYDTIDVLMDTLSTSNQISVYISIVFTMIFKFCRTNIIRILEFMILTF